ncbi:MAG: hypothetical protein LQ348_001810 [Seirophora lacunosa]|nr:MAG: hypothetical protein LQ348_001810 [Seirophora lacunosa]
MAPQALLRSDAVALIFEQWKQKRFDEMVRSFPYTSKAAHGLRRSRKLAIRQLKRKTKEHRERSGNEEDKEKRKRKTQKKEKGERSGNEEDREKRKGQEKEMGERSRKKEDK